MGEDICLFTKDTVIIKPPKKSPASLRVLVFAFAVVCSLYIWSVCLNQANFYTGPISPGPEVNPVQRCHNIGIDKSQTPYFHYPNPTTFSRDECACNPVRLFVVVSMQRSGSGWFETFLNSHLNVSSNGEIFSVMERRRNVSSILSTLDRVFNMDWSTSANKNQCSAAIGFKWMLNQGLMEYHKEIVEYFNDRGVSVIFLLRRNHLRRIVSLLANSFDRNAKLLNGVHKSHVHSRQEAETLAGYKPTINLTSLTMDLKQMENMVFDALFHFHSTRHMVLYYEELLKNRTKLVDVQKFLALPPMELTSRQVKIHKGPLSDHVKNWDDVKKTLRGTTYETFLHSDETNSSSLIFLKEEDHLVFVDADHYLTHDGVHPRD
ncbi:hypothetical protein F511_08218 [Dorcoceras hygrometricum]|uniref:Sulfotransferase n=1 Tax=Dorcoceras hygrometricum TaxID=472368 RepID=A0A2Z7BZR4_9LAMI|nr:hypothetical protein F511_08218 [Dorcoceras hygrometricum]